MDDCQIVTEALKQKIGLLIGAETGPNPAHGRGLANERGVAGGVDLSPPPIVMRASVIIMSNIFDQEVSHKEDDLKS